MHQNAGLIQELENFLNLGNVLNLNDTLHFWQADCNMITSLKWILHCFENLSGLKINCDKSVMVLSNISD
jgi:hypothetical protein